MHDTQTIFNEFCIELGRQGFKPDGLSIMKLIYFAQGWSLAIFDQLIIKEPIIIGKYGPEINSIIESDWSRNINNTNKLLLNNDIDKKTLSIIKKIVSEYGNFNVYYLFQLSSTAGTPWNLLKDKQKIGTAISNDIIKNYYKYKIEDFYKYKNSQKGI